MLSYIVVSPKFKLKLISAKFWLPMFSRNELYNTIYSMVAHTCNNQLRTMTFRSTSLVVTPHPHGQYHLSARAQYKSVQPHAGIDCNLQYTRPMRPLRKYQTESIFHSFSSIPDELDERNVLDWKLIVFRFYSVFPPSTKITIFFHF